MILTKTVKTLSKVKANFITTYVKFFIDFINFNVFTEKYLHSDTFSPTLKPIFIKISITGIFR